MTHTLVLALTFDGTPAGLAEAAARALADGVLPLVELHGARANASGQVRLADGTTADYDFDIHDGAVSLADVQRETIILDPQRQAWLQGLIRKDG